MTYARTDWNNGAPPALNADHLNNIEAGIVDVDDRTTDLEGSLSNAETVLFRMVSRDEDIEAHGASTAASDNATQIQAALTAAKTAGGNVYSPRDGYYKINSTVYVPNKVVLYGSGRYDAGIQAGASFPISVSPLIQLGEVADTVIFGSRVESMTLDGNSRAITAVYSSAANEQCGIRNVVVGGFTQYGVHFNPGSIVSVEDSEIYPQAGGATAGIYFQGTAGDNLVKRVTIGVNGALTDGILVTACQLAVVSLHVENCTDGIDIDNSAVGIVGISGPSTLANVTNLIHGRSNTRYSSALNIVKGTATNAVLDDFFGVTLTDSNVPLWVGGDAQIARLKHTGDRLRFFGGADTTKQTVTGSRGGNAALASLLTALANYGLITDSSS